MPDVVVYGRSSRSQIQPPPEAGSQLTASLTETLHLVSNAVTIVPMPSAIVAFAASAGHATVTNYAARIFAYPAGTFVDAEDLGVPTPDGNFMIVVDLDTFFGAQGAGDYTLVIRATDAGGSTDSPASSPFTLPLP